MSAHCLLWFVSRSAGECHEFLGHLLYDIMQGTGRSDCKQFKSMTGMDATFFNLAAGAFALFSLHLPLADCWNIH